MGSKVFQKLQSSKNISFLIYNNSNKNSFDSSFDSSHYKKFYDNEKLFIIIPYYTYSYNEENELNIINFIDKYHNHIKAKIYLIEGLYKTVKPLNIPSKYDIIHVKINITDMLYIRENLINVAINNLPKNWNYLSWIDYNINFTNPNWINETIDKLDIYDIIHLYDNVVHFDKNNVATHITYSLFREFTNNSNNIQINNPKYTSNYAWGCSRKGYDIIEDLIDFNIIDSSEKMMAFAMIGKVKELCNYDKLSNEYKDKLIEFQNKCEDNIIRVNNITGTILNYYNYNYNNFDEKITEEGLKILIENKYSPNEDIVYNKHKLITLTSHGKRLEKNIKEHLIKNASINKLNNKYISNEVISHQIDNDNISDELMNKLSSI